jgi:hypothetical protein
MIDVQAVHYASMPPPEDAAVDAVSFMDFGIVDDECHEDVDVPQASSLAKLGELLHGQRLNSRGSSQSSELVGGSTDEALDAFQMHSMQPPTELDEEDMPEFEGGETALELLAGNGVAASSASKLGFDPSLRSGIAARQGPDMGIKDGRSASAAKRPYSAQPQAQARHLHQLDPASTQRCTPRAPFWSIPAGCATRGQQRPAPMAPFSCLTQPDIGEDMELEVPETEIMTVPLRTKEQRVDWRDFLCEMVATKKASSLYLLYDVDAEPPPYERPPPSDPARYHAVGGFGQAPKEPPETNCSSSKGEAAIAETNGRAPSETRSEEPKPLDEPAPWSPLHSPVVGDCEQESPEREIPPIHEPGETSLGFPEGEHSQFMKSDLLVSGNATGL